MACLPYAFPAPQDEDPDKDDNLRGCRNVALVGAVMFAVGLPLFMYGDEKVSKQVREQTLANDRRNAELVAEREQRIRTTREHAWAATQEAAKAARAGDCGAVVVRARYVRNLDADFFATVFARDTAIKRCLPAVVPPRDRIEDREQAFALLKRATRAARAGNCAAVLELEVKIRELDSNVHDAWFVLDDAIKVCLAPMQGTQAAPTDALEAP